MCMSIHIIKYVYIYEKVFQWVEQFLRIHCCPLLSLKEIQCFDYLIIQYT